MLPKCSEQRREQELTPSPAGYQFVQWGLDYTKNNFSSFLIRNLGGLPITKILNKAQLDTDFLHL